MAQITPINEQDFVLARVAVLAGTIHKPQGRWNLRIQKQLGRQVDDAINQVALGNQGPANIALTAGFAGECPFRQHHARPARGSQMIDKML